MMEGHPFGGEFMPAAASPNPQTIADAAERLMAAYERWIPLSSVTAVVAECRRQLTQATHHAMSPMSVYQVANERLRGMIEIPEVAT
jgi:hypothetical protein